MPINNDQYSFISGVESERSIENSPRGDDVQRAGTVTAEVQGPTATDVAMQGGHSPLLTPPPLYSTDDYKIDNTQLTPKLVKSLMHRRVTKISSGGVHNICIVEPHGNKIVEDVY